MTQPINRRDFIKNTTLIGISSLVLGSTGTLTAGTPPDIAVAIGKDSFKATKKAMEKLGGMERFVDKNAKVAILANVQRNNPGVYTHPEIVKAVIEMCKKAGAAQIDFLSWLPESNWENTGLKNIILGQGAKLVLVNQEDETQFTPYLVDRGVVLKETKIFPNLFDYQVFINMPITKDHAGNKFTGALKNLMGVNSPQSNRTFHLPNWTTDADAILHLEQSIADLNTLIKPTLSIVDATEFITTNGPFGPGELLTPRKVVAGIDRVAIDAYCCSLWNLNPQNISSIVKANAHGLGEIDLKKVVVKEFSV